MAVYRSFLFRAGNHTRRVEKALSLDADATILDLEDACPIAEKRGRVPSRSPPCQRPRTGSATSASTPRRPVRLGDIVAVVQRASTASSCRSRAGGRDQGRRLVIANLREGRACRSARVDVLPIIETGKGMANIAPSPRPARASGVSPSARRFHARHEHRVEPFRPERAAALSQRVRPCSRAAGIEARSTPCG